MSESCWLIEYSNGFKVIMSEQQYKQQSEDKLLDRDNILIESHYFDIDICKHRNLTAVIMSENY